MTATDSKALSVAKQTVADVLGGKLTRLDKPELFDDDVVYLQVEIAARGAPDWLIAHIADRSLPFAGRLEVLRALSGKLRREALALLQTERPDDPTLAMMAEL